MALTKGNKAQWSDIQNLYNKLNTARSKFSITQVSVPANPGLFFGNQTTNLSSQVDAMKSNSYIGQTAVTGVTAPSKGEPISPEDFSIISSTIDKIQNTCAHDAAFNGTHRASNLTSNLSTYNSGYRSSNYTTDDTSDYVSDHSSHRASNLSSNNSPVYGTHYSSYYASRSCSGNNSPVYGTHYSSYYASKNRSK